MYFNNHINVLIRSKSYLPVLQIYFLPRTYMFMNLIKMDIINHRYNKVHPVDKIPRALPLSSSRCSSTHSWFFSEWISIYKPSDMWQTLWHQSSEPLKQNKIKPISCSASPNKTKKGNCFTCEEYSINLFCHVLLHENKRFIQSQNPWWRFDSE